MATQSLVGTFVSFFKPSAHLREKEGKIHRFHSTAASTWCQISTVTSVTKSKLFSWSYTDKSNVKIKLQSLPAHYSFGFFGSILQDCSNEKKRFLFLYVPTLNN